jgi:uncharacterized membrane protein YagU involved in acid resistance
MADPVANPVVLVLAGGCIAAALDIVFACVYWALSNDVAPSRILQSVAAGVLGQSSFEGGFASAALGLVLHFLIVLVMALAYYAAALRLAALRERAVLFGAAYGLVLYAIMNYVVVPLSRAATGPREPLWLTLGIAVHVFFIGIPIALFCRGAANRKLAGSS